MKIEWRGDVIAKYAYANDRYLGRVSLHADGKYIAYQGGASGSGGKAVRWSRFMKKAQEALEAAVREAEDG